MHCEMSTLVVLVLLASCSVIALVAEAQEDCQRPPLWIFFREEDVETIFPTLPGSRALQFNFSHTLQVRWLARLCTHDKLCINYVIVG